MSTAQITIDQAGNNHLSIDGSPASPIHGTGQEAQTAAMNQIRDYAARTNQTISLHVQENSGATFNLQIAPDGQVWTAPPSEPQPTPTRDWEQEAAPIAVPRIDQGSAPTVTDAPRPEPQEDPDLETTRPRIIALEQGQPETTHATPPAAPAPQPEHAISQPQPTGTEPTSATPAPAAQQDYSVSASPADSVETDSRWADITQQPATQGFRGTLNGMGLNLAPTEQELEQRRETLRQQIAREEQERLAAEEHARTEAAQEGRRAAREREAAAKDKAERTLIQTAFEEPKNVLIANDKGGQGKTTAGYCIGATAGRIRGGDVVAWDANETRGNLGFRSQKAPVARSVVDLLEEAAEDFTTVQGSKRSTLARYTRNQGDNLFTVLASDESRDRQDLVDADAFAKVHEILGRFYSLILIDTGNNHRVSHFTAALAATDRLVIPVGAGADGAYAAETMMDSFEGLGYGDLVKNAVVLLNDSATRRGDATGIAARFQERVRAIIPIPFDPALDSGEEIDFDSLQPATRAAYQEATAAICAGLAEAD